MNRRKWARPEKMLWLAPGLIFGFVGLTVYAPKFSRTGEAWLETLNVRTDAVKYERQCQLNQKQMAVGMMLYLQDYDARFPPVRSGGSAFGWADALTPYLMRGSSLFHCPDNLKLRAPATFYIDPHALNYTEYFLNSRLSGQPTNRLTDGSQTILFGEGIASDARYALSQLPSKWTSDLNSPAHLHFGRGSATQSGANYAFADGHVKWFEPQHVLSSPLAPGKGPFASSPDDVTFALGPN